MSGADMIEIDTSDYPLMALILAVLSALTTFAAFTAVVHLFG
jgi:hypothetical protein